MTLLDEVVDSATSDDKSTGALLRQMLVLGHRLKSQELSSWAASELNGYGDADFKDYPRYRGPLQVIVHARGGPEQVPRREWRVESRDMPESLSDRNIEALLCAYLHQPLAQLERLAASDDPIRIVWSNAQVSKYNEWIKSGEAVNPYKAKAEMITKVVTPSLVHGIVDTIRTRALLFALNLQQDYPNAGETNGPTTESEKVRELVTNNFHTNIYGGNNTVANGENITQNMQVNQGDAEALLAYLKGQGLDEDGQAELKAAVIADGSKPGTAVAGFLDRVASGAITFGTNIAAPVALELAKQAISSFFGFPMDA